MQPQRGPKPAISTADAPQSGVSRIVPVGTIHALLLPAAELPLRNTMNRKQRQLVSIWICMACQACNSASAELCLSCGRARLRRELLGLRR